jgi:hypothetical protein
MNGPIIFEYFRIRGRPRRFRQRSSSLAPVVACQALVADVRVSDQAVAGGLGGAR